MKKENFTNFARLILFCVVLGLTSCDGNDGGDSLTNESITSQELIISDAKKMVRQ